MIILTQKTKTHAFWFHDKPRESLQVEPWQAWQSSVWVGWYDLWAFDDEPNSIRDVKFKIQLDSIRFGPSLAKIIFSNLKPTFSSVELCIWYIIY